MVPIPPDGVVRWRSLSPRHWVARRDGRHLGAVERGRRWVATDAQSDPLGSFRTFAEAQAAVADMRPPVPTRTPPPWGSAILLVAAGSTTAMSVLAVWPLATR